MNDMFDRENERESEVPMPEENNTAPYERAVGGEEPKTDDPATEELFGEAETGGVGERASFAADEPTRSETASTPSYTTGTPWDTPYAGGAQSGPAWNGTEYSYRPVGQSYNPNENGGGYYRAPGAQGVPRAEQAAYNGYSAQRPAEPPRGKKKKAPRAKISGGAVAVLLVVCIIVSGLAGFGGALLSNRFYGGTAANGGASSVIHNTVPSNQNLGETNYDVSNVVEAVADSVVEIVTEKVTTGSIFGQYVESGAGSGVIITADGYIITCAHVIDGATTVTVTLTDGTDYVATVIGSDAQTDIALIKIEATGLTCAVIGDSDTLVVGEPVIAIGNPLGELGGTVTNGIISALEREITIDGTTYTLLQTNTAVNSGNSGGALFDINGELIGIVNAKQSGSGIEGLGFAIPINGAIDIAEQLRENGYVKGRPMFGISLYDVSDETAYYGLRGSEVSALLNYVTSYGVYFVQYQEGQSGELQFGDRIVAVDGVSISALSDLKEVLAEHVVGDTLTITVSRVSDLRTGRANMVEISITLIESNSAQDN